MRNSRMLSAQQTRRFRRPVEIVSSRTRVPSTTREYFRVSSLAVYCDGPQRTKIMALLPMRSHSPDFGA